MLKNLKFKVRFAVISGLLFAGTNSTMAMEMDDATNPIKRAIAHEGAGETLQALELYRALALTSGKAQQAAFYLKAGDLSFKYYEESLSNAHNLEETKVLSFREARALVVKSVTYLEESKVHYASALNSADGSSQKRMVSLNLIDFYKKPQVQNLEKLGEYYSTAAFYSSSETDKVAFYRQAAEALEKTLSQLNEVYVSPRLAACFLHSAFYSQDEGQKKGYMEKTKDLFYSFTNKPKNRSYPSDIFLQNIILYSKETGNPSLESFVNQYLSNNLPEITLLPNPVLPM